jgi:hypothetical protein
MDPQARNPQDATEVTEAAGVSGAGSGLPFVDEQRITIAAPRDLVWEALRHYVDVSLATGGEHPLGKVLGAEPPCGFERAGEVEGRHVSLAGRHRFARYLLTFDLADAADPAADTRTQAAVGGERTLLTAGTYATFPGPRGRMYRTLVIGTRLHVLAVRRMLRAVERRSLRPAGHDGA